MAVIAGDVESTTAPRLTIRPPWRKILDSRHLRPVRLVAQDSALSRRRQGFDSPTGYSPVGSYRTDRRHNPAFAGLFSFSGKSISPGASKHHAGFRPDWPPTEPGFALLWRGNPSGMRPLCRSFALPQRRAVNGCQAEREAASRSEPIQWAANIGGKRDRSRIETNRGSHDEDAPARWLYWPLANHCVHRRVGCVPSSDLGLPPEFALPRTKASLVHGSPSLNRFSMESR